MYKIDLHGQRFGKWSVLRYLGNAKWLCLCDCGTEKAIFGGSLRYQSTTQCQPCGFKATAKTRTQDLTGQKVNRWTFVSRLPDGYWLADCDCGNRTRVFAPNVKNGTSKGCENCGHKKLPGTESAINKVLREYKDGATKRGLEWRLTRVEFITIITAKCGYCGKTPTDEPVRSYRMGKYTETLYYNGIDRLDNNKGYHAGNVITCCTLCNRAKRELSLDVFRVWLERLHTSTPS